MTSKVGRNDPCPCGSGKKYKSCCLQKETSSTPSYTSAGKRKFTAKVLSGGGMVKMPTSSSESTKTTQPPMVDYNTLMERSFGEAIHTQDEKPPVPNKPLQYLSPEEEPS